MYGIINKNWCDCRYFSPPLLFGGDLVVMNRRLAFNQARIDYLRTYPTVSGRRIKQGSRHFPRRGGVYVIYRIRDGKTYIGESNQLNRRMVEHFTTQQPNQTVDWAIYKEGPEHFRGGVICIEDDYHRRRKLETKYVKLLNSYYNGYNSTNDGKRKHPVIHWLYKQRQSFLYHVFPSRFRQLQYQNTNKLRFRSRLRRWFGTGRSE